MSRRARLRDDALVERLRRREVSWDDRQDEAVAGLLSLARSVDRLAPPTEPPVRPASRRRAHPALAGLATTAVAGVAFAFAGITGSGATGGTTTPTTSTPTTGTDVAAVSAMLDQVTTDLARATTAPAASKAALLAHATSVLHHAEQRTAQLPPQDRAPLAASSRRLQSELTRRQPGHPAGATTPPSTPAPRGGGAPGRAPGPRSELRSPDP